MPEHRVRSHTRNTRHGAVGVRSHTRRHRGANAPRGEAAAPPRPPAPARSIAAGVGGSFAGLASVLLATSGLTIAAVGMAVSAVGFTVAAIGWRKPTTRTATRTTPPPAPRKTPARPAAKPKPTPQNEARREVAAPRETPHRSAAGERLGLRPETEAERKFWQLRESGYRGPIDQDGNPVD